MPLDPDYLRRQLGLPVGGDTTPAPNPEMVAKSSPVFPGAYGQQPSFAQPSYAQQGAPPAPSYQPPSYQPTSPAGQPQTTDSNGNPYGSPYDQRITDLEKQYSDIATQPAKKQNPWLQGAFLALEGIRNFATPKNAQPIEWLGEAKKQDKLNRIGTQLAPLYDIRKTEADNAYRQAQTRNIYEDNQRQELERQDKASVAASTAQDRKRAAFMRTHKFFDPVTASEADKRQLAAIGETPESIGKFDFTKPNFKMVGGTEYKYNPQTGALEDTGVKDPSKSVVEYEVTDPATGVTSKYATTSEKAASLKTQLTAAGMQINAANERQTKQQGFELKKQQAAKQLQQALADHKALIDEQKATSDQKRKMEIQDRIDERARMIRQLQGGLQDLLNGNDQQQ